MQTGTWKNCPTEIARNIVSAIQNIKKDPYQFIKKLKASNPVYSFRVRGDVRALLSIHDDVLIIHVLEIDYQKQAYRDFQKAKITK